MSIECRKGCKLVDKSKGCGHKLHSRYTHPITHKRDREPLHTADLEKAREVERIFLAQLETEAFKLKHFPELAQKAKLKPPIPTFREYAAVPDARASFEGGKWWTAYANDHYAPRSAEATRDFYRSRVKALLRYEPFANARLNEINKLMIDEFVAFWHRTHKPYTVNQDVDVLKFLLRMAYDWEIIDRLPKFPGKRERLKREKRGRMIPLPDELAYLAAVQQAGYRDLSDLIQLCIDESMEPGEVILRLLDWSHISLDNLGPGYELGIVYDPFTKRPTRQRNLPITTPRLHQVLLARWEDMGRPTKGLVFEHPQKPGEPISYDTLTRQHGNVWHYGWVTIPYFRPYDCRHTFISRLKKFGGDPYDVQGFAGWAQVNPEVEADYTHDVNRERLGRAAILYREGMARAMAAEGGLSADLATNKWTMKSELKSALETHKQPLNQSFSAEQWSKVGQFWPGKAHQPAPTDNIPRDEQNGGIGPKSYI